MGKNKLKKFADMQTFNNVFQCAMFEMTEDNAVRQMAGKWRETYFHNDHPIVLELGCGHGEYTVGLAKKYPEKNFIGVDIKGARMWVGAKMALEEKLQNVAFLRINIEWLASFFFADEIDEIWITFPDPQMKKATKRLTSSFFMQRYQKVMKDGGKIHLKTDSPFLYAYTREMIKVNEYTCLVDTSNLYLETENDANQLTEARTLQTHYEKQWLDRGMDIKFLSWILNHKSEFSEPEIEIEKDTYRSYGRNYVSTTNN